MSENQTMKLKIMDTSIRRITDFLPTQNNEKQINTYEFYNQYVEIMKQYKKYTSYNQLYYSKMYKVMYGMQICICGGEFKQSYSLKKHQYTNRHLNKMAEKTSEISKKQTKAKIGTFKNGTYCSGFVMKTVVPLSKHDYYEISKSLSNKLNEYYGHTQNKKIKIVPERITEGGFQFMNINGYKSFRHHFRNSRWTYVENEHCDEWLNDNTVIYQPNDNINTCLKAFQSAPVWTKTELIIFKNVFESNGFICGKI
jgi:hypothetical protein